jgi:serine/threonine protein phosphatase 1
VALSRFGAGSRGGPATDKGERIYAIGDVHGRLDLLTMMFDRIGAHTGARAPARSTHVVMIGDLIDRGPDSAGVLRYLFRLQARSSTLLVLRGNHEELMLRALAGEPGMMRAWIRTGGDATLRSFGVEPPVDDSETLPAINALLAAMPSGMLEWLRGLPMTARSGDYLFCHAGIRPGVPIKRQSRDDLLWIRGDFLEDDTDHGVIVVHGHSISADVDARPNRIGIDTGAYRTGRLTALCLDNNEVDVLSVEADPSVASAA